MQPVLPLVDMVLCDQFCLCWAGLSRRGRKLRICLGAGEAGGDNRGYKSSWLGWRCCYRSVLVPVWDAGEGYNVVEGAFLRDCPFDFYVVPVVRHCAFRDCIPAVPLFSRKDSL